MTEDKPRQNTNLAFEEFELFYKSTERVTDQRLSLNQWNFSICTAIFVTCAAVFNWSTSNPNFLLAAIITIIILCIMATLFCSLWIGNITQFKELNRAKFIILNDMAPYIKFSHESNDQRVSHEPFLKEWKILEARNSLVQVTDTKIVALKPSSIEYLIPKVFQWLFGFIIAVSIILVILNWSLIVSTPILTVTASPTPTLSPSTIPTP